MKSHFLSILATLIAIQSQCQISNMNDATGNPIRVSSYDKVEGSPYLNDGNWNSGIIITQTDKYLSDLKIRYNAYEDEVQYLNNGNPFFYKNQDVKSFEFSVVDQLGNVERFYFKNGFEYQDEIEKTNFLRVLYEGKSIKLLSKIECRKQMVTPASYGERDYEKFIITMETYLWVDGSIRELALRKGKISSEFPELKGELKNYFKENVVDLNNAKEVEDLFEFIDNNLNSN